MAPWHSLYLKRKLCGASKIINFLPIKGKLQTGTEIRNRKYFQRGKEQPGTFSIQQSSLKIKIQTVAQIQKVLLILYAFKKIGKTLLKQILQKFKLRLYALVQ
jgi:hypothetical protein